MYLAFKPKKTDSQEQCTTTLEKCISETKPGWDQTDLDLMMTRLNSSSLDLDNNVAKSPTLP